VKVAYELKYTCCYYLNNAQLTALDCLLTSFAPGHIMFASERHAARFRYPRLFAEERFVKLSVFHRVQPTRPQSRATRWIWASVFLLGFVGCGTSDSATEPESSVADRGLSFRAYSFSREGLDEIAQISLSIPGPRKNQVDAEPRVTLIPPAAADLRGGITARPTFGLLPRLDSIRANRGPTVRVQPRNEGRRFETRTSDGRLAHAIVSTYIIPGSRDAGAVVSLYADDRLVAIQELVLRGAANQRRIRASRLTLFDSTGAAIIAVESGPESSAQTASLPRSPPPDALAVATGFLAPTIAHAAVPIQSGVPCMRQWLGFIGTSIMELGALGATSVIALSCFYTGGLTCPGLTVALASAVGASLAFFSAVMDLEECLRGAGHSLFGGRTGIPFGGEECYMVSWWISYDDGQTWQLLSTEMVCAPVNAT